GAWAGYGRALRGMDADFERFARMEYRQRRGLGFGALGVALRAADLARADRNRATAHRAEKFPNSESVHGLGDLRRNCFVRIADRTPVAGVALRQSGVV